MGRGDSKGVATNPLGGTHMETTLFVECSFMLDQMHYLIELHREGEVVARENVSQALLEVLLKQQVTPLAVVGLTFKV